VQRRHRNVAQKGLEWSAQIRSLAFKRSTRVPVRCMEKNEIELLAPVLTVEGSSRIRTCQKRDIAGSWSDTFGSTLEHL
jgi:hypothetical protein